MIIQRLIENKLSTYANQFRAIAITGARQTGKTTLAKKVFPNKPYVNFENPDVQIFAKEDARGFLEKFKNTGAIFDEIHRSPEIFSYLQEILDNETETGKYILTGSSNFLLNEKVGQSLAGRVGFLQLQTFSAKESLTMVSEKPSLTELIFAGGYPEIWSKKINPTFYFSSYVQSFVEKDIRQISNISNIILYQQFIKLAATRASQEWNSSSIATELGIDYKTVQSWLSLLVTAGIVYLVPPFYQNFGKRLVKRPKLYFNDTGLLCYLLGISIHEHFEYHPMKGEIFENFVFNEISKYNELKILSSNIYYWRTISGVELDLILENSLKSTGVEIKYGKTYQANWWKNIAKWREMSSSNTKGKVIYTGTENSSLSDDRELISVWDLFEKFSK